MKRGRKAPPRAWPLQDAKNKLSEVVDEATRTGPQVITRRGVETAVVLAISDYARLTSAQRKGGLGDFFLASPLRGSGLDVARSRDVGREVKL
jgi:prevent-host-death family protein